jgi:hypothetical protein
MSDVNFSQNAPAVPAGAGAPTMSTPETLAGIFFEPERTFEALRERPRFLVVGLIILALSLGVITLVMQKVNFNEFITAQIRKQTQDEAQRERATKIWTGPAGKFFVYGLPVVAVAVSFAAGGALYMLATMAMGGAIRYKQAVSVWGYSGFPPTLLASLVALVLLFMKAKEDIDLNRSGAGLAVTNLGALLGAGSSPVLRAALGWFDVFTFYGMFLAALGLRKVGKLSAGSAWTIVLVFWFLAMIFSVCRALISPAG